MNRLQKHKIPVSSDTISQVEKSDLESVHILLSVLYHFHLNRPMVAKLNVISESNSQNNLSSVSKNQILSKGALQKLNTLGKSRVESPVAPAADSPPATDIVKQSAKAAVLLCDMDEETFTGKIASLKLLCALLGAPEPPAKTRYATLPGIARELLSERLEAMEYSEIEQISELLVQRVIMFCV